MASTQDRNTKQTTFDKLLEPLRTKLKAIEDKRKIHHRETLSFTAFVRLLVYYFTTPLESGRQLLNSTLSAAQELGLLKVKRSTFFDAFKRFPVEWFVGLLSVLLTSIVWKTIPEMDMLGKLYCVDGSLFPALATMLWAEYQSQNNAVRLHLVFELNRMIAVQFIIDAGNSNEKTTLAKMIEAGVTYIADRGYAKFSLLAEIAVNAYFVFRMKKNLKYAVVEMLTVNLPQCVQHIFSAVSDRRVRLPGAKGKPIYRLVIFWVGKEQYLILTNRLDLTTFQVILLYAYRWQVELVFRFLKRTIGGLHLLSTSKEGVTIQFYVLLIAALLQLHLKQQCIAACERPTVQVSSENAIAGLMVDEALLMGARGSTFLATVGKKLHRYWKISIHWLNTLRNLLTQPFGHRAILLLGRVCL